MGTKGREIVGEHAERVIELLNKALADEWLAYYQYWTGAKVVFTGHSGIDAVTGAGRSRGRYCRHSRSPLPV